MKTLKFKKVVAVLMALTMAFTVMAISASAKSDSFSVSIYGGTWAGYAEATRTSSTSVYVDVNTSFTGSGTRVVGFEAVYYPTGGTAVSNITNSGTSFGVGISGTIPVSSAITTYSSHEIRTSSGSSVKYYSFVNI